MSVAMSFGLLNPVSAMADDEKPVVAVKMVPSLEVDHVRRRFHLALILDCSGSMEGDRIASVKETLQLLIGAMEDGDRLTLITYESKARSLAVAVELNEQNRTKLLEATASLEATNGTNLGKGIEILKGIAKSSGRFPTILKSWFKGNSSTHPVDSVFIMTDGQINEGVTEPSGILKLLADTGLPAAGVPINTLGYGSDHNKSLLRDIAVWSRGTYTYADTDELLPTIIGDIIAGLATEVGRCAKLSIPDGWRCLELGSSDDERQRSYTIGTFIADKTQWVVLEGPPKNKLENIEKTTFVLTWRVVGPNPSIATQTCCLRDEASKLLDPVEVAEQVDRTKVAREMGNVSEMLQRGEAEKVQASLEQLELYLNSSKAKNQEFSSRMIENVKEMKSKFSVQRRSSNGSGSDTDRDATIGGAPSFEAMASRAASNAVALGMQRGFYCSENNNDNEEEQFSFSNPHQKSVQTSMKQRYGELKSKRK